MKSLVPLIIFLFLIILSTVVITNYKIYRPHNADETEQRVIKMSPYSAPRKNTPKVLRSRDEAASVSREEIRQLENKALTEYHNGNTDKAENALRDILIFEPDNFTALSLLGRILYDGQRYHEAETIFRKQTELKSTDSLVYSNLAQALAKQKKFDEALEKLNVARELDPESPVISINLSGLYSVTGQKEKSLHYFRLASEKIGDKIIPMSFDPTLKNIRSEPEFQEIIANLKKPPETENKDSGNPAPEINKP